MIAETFCKSGPLQASLESLWLDGNQIVELPETFCELTSLKDIRLSYNPIISPPAELASEGIKSIQQYCRIRQDRLERIQVLLKKDGFEIDPEQLTPVTKDFLVGGLGYLSLKDIKELNARINSFVNGRIYLQAISANALVELFTVYK